MTIDWTQCVSGIVSAVVAATCLAIERRAAGAWSRAPGAAQTPAATALTPVPNSVAA